MNTLNAILCWLYDNWLNLVILAAFAFVIVYEIMGFTQLSVDERIKNLKAWLLLAVVEAEKELGSKTGALKLRLVYDMAVSKFPWVSTAVSFETFAGWVDEALVEMKKMLNDNKAVAEYVDKE